MNNKAIIFGITGQDGSYLAELLLGLGYEVHGVIRRHSNISGTKHIDHILDKLKLHYGDVTDSLSVTNLINTIKPKEVYNLAAQSHVKVSFDVPQYTSNVDAIGTLNILESIRLFSPETKFYQASTSELYGGLEYNKNSNGMYDETCAFHPRSPYGVSKIYSYWMVRNYREAYNLFACNGVLFNHESPRRGETFVTRKITKGLADIKREKQKTLKLGNLDAKRDWGYAKDYVYGMYLMLQQDKPQDYVLATGKEYTVRFFVEQAAKFCGWNIVWKGEGVNEKGYDAKTGKLIVEIDEKYFRPSEVDVLIGDATKAKKELDWYPETDIYTLIEIMMRNDLF